MGGQSMALVGQACEISTPFVNFRWMLDKAGMKQSTLYLANGITMVSLFVLFRVFLYGAVMILIYNQRDGLLTLPVLNICVFVGCYFIGLALQVLWASKMIKGAQKLLAGKKVNDSSSELRKDT